MFLRKVNGRFSSKLAADRARNLARVRHKNTKQDSSCPTTHESRSLLHQSGRRIVDLGQFAADLQKCSSSKCQLAQDITRTVKETKIGLASIFFGVKCECGQFNKVQTSESHRSGGAKCGMPIFDINSKMALSMLHSGVPQTAVERMMTVLGVPPMTTKALKAPEREVDPAVEAIAMDSCSNVLSAEQQYCSEMTTAYNMGW